MSLGSNGVDRVRSLQQIQMWLCVTNICTCSAYFAPSFISQLNYPKCTQIVQNATKHDFWIQWGGSGAFVVKNFDATSWKRTFCTSSAYFALSFIRQTIVPNTPNSTKCAKIWVQGPMGWNRCVRCEKFRRNFVLQTFALVRPVLHRVS